MFLPPVLLLSKGVKVTILYTGVLTRVRLPVLYDPRGGQDWVPLDYAPGGVREKIDVS